MNAAQHTPGPWTQQDDHGRRWIETSTGNDDVICSVMRRDCKVASERDIEFNANARLIAAAPDLLAWIETEYTFLADSENNWPGRHTVSGQLRLGSLRDLIARATGREPQDVQDDYGNRAPVARSAA